jgi:hypothetical protein
MRKGELHPSQCCDSPCHLPDKFLEDLVLSRRQILSKSFNTTQPVASSTMADAALRMTTNRPIPTQFLNPQTGDRGDFFPDVGFCTKTACFECEAQFRSEYAQQTLDYMRYTTGLSISQVGKISRR